MSVDKRTPCWVIWIGLLMTTVVPPVVAANQLKPSAEGVDPPPRERKSSAHSLAPVTVQASTSSNYASADTSAATRLSLDLLDTPQSVSIISRQRMTDQQLNTVKQVLDNTTGIEANGYDSERVVYWSRGFQIENMAYDGVPVAAGLNIGSVDGALDTSVYDRIEVVRGATGLLSGSGSPSAMINFVRKQADSRRPQLDISVSYGAWANKRVSLDAATALNAKGTLRGRWVLTHADGDSFLDRYRSNRNVLYGIVEADLGPQTVVSLGYEYQCSMPRGITWGSFPLFYADGGRIPVSTRFSPAARWTHWTNMTQSAFISLHHHFANDWQLHAEFDHRKLNADTNLFYMYGFPDRHTGGGLQSYVYKSEQSGQQNMADLYASGPMHFFGREHELVAGVYVSDYDSNSYYYPNLGVLADFDFNHWTGDYPYPNFSSQAQKVTVTRLQQQGGYVAARLQLADALKLIVGSRYSRWQNHSNDASYGLEQETQTKLLPYAGLVYALIPDLTVFSSFTKIFDPQTNRGADGKFLQPMVGTSSELGIKGRWWDGGVNTSLTFFNTRESQVAQADPGHYLADGVTQVYIPLNGTRSRGFEFENSGQIGQALRATVGFSHYNIKAPGYGAVHPSLPRASLRSFAVYSLSGRWSGLSLGGGLNWQNAINIPVLSPSGNNLRIHQTSVMLMSLTARYVFNEHATVQINGENLLHKKYFIADDSADFSFGAPANVMLSFNYRFF